MGFDFSNIVETTASIVKTTASSVGDFCSDHVIKHCKEACTGIKDFLGGILKRITEENVGSRKVVQSFSRVQGQPASASQSSAVGPNNTLSPEQTSKITISKERPNKPQAPTSGPPNKRPGATGFKPTGQPPAMPKSQPPSKVQGQVASTPANKKPPLPTRRPPKPSKESPKNVKRQQSNELQSVGPQNNAAGQKFGSSRSYRPLPPDPTPKTSSELTQPEKLGIRPGIVNETRALYENKIS